MRRDERVVRASPTLVPLTDALERRRTRVGLCNLVVTSHVSSRDALPTLVPVSLSRLLGLDRLVSQLAPFCLAPAASDLDPVWPSVSPQSSSSSAASSTTSLGAASGTPWSVRQANFDETWPAATTATTMTETTVGRTNLDPFPTAPEASRALEIYFERVEPSLGLYPTDESRRSLDLVRHDELRDAGPSLLEAKASYLATVASSAILSRNAAFVSSARDWIDMATRIVLDELRESFFKEREERGGGAQGMRPSFEPKLTDFVQISHRVRRSDRFVHSSS